MDRNNYPQNTGVVITIDDQAMNVDPTSEDVWVFGTNGVDPLWSGYCTLKIFGTAADERDARIATALAAMNQAIRTAQEALDKALDKGALDTNTALADEVINDPIAADTEKLRLVKLYGFGSRTVNADVTTVNACTTLNEVPDNYKGSMLIEYEEAAGRGDRDSNTDINTTTSEPDPNYKGMALIAFERDSWTWRPEMLMQTEHAGHTAILFWTLLQTYLITTRVPALIEYAGNSWTRKCR